MGAGDSDVGAPFLAVDRVIGQTAVGADVGGRRDLRLAGLAESRDDAAHQGVRRHRLDEDFVHARTHGAGNLDPVDRGHGHDDRQVGGRAAFGAAQKGREFQARDGVQVPIDDRQVRLMGADQAQGLGAVTGQMNIAHA